MSEFVVGVCAMTACVFGASAAGKLRSRAAYRAYRSGLGANQLVPGHLLATAAAVLAACEALTLTIQVRVLAREPLDLTLIIQRIW